MTDIKKKDKGKSGVKSEKLRLNKETLKDLSLKKRAGADPKGAQAAGTQWRCTGVQSGCAAT